MLTGADGQVRDRRELPTPASQTPETLHDALSALVSPLQAHMQRVIIASTGIIRDGSLLALNPHNLDGLLHFLLVKTLEQLTNLPTIATNDAQIATWVGFQALDGDIADMIFIAVSTGVGGGVVSGCKLLTSPGGLVGHIGYILADPCDPICGCGRTGCMEAIVLGRGTAAAMQGELTGADTKTTFTCAGQDDEQAQQLIHRSIRMLARLIADIKAATDRQYVVVSSSAGLAEGYLALMETCLVQKPAVFHIDLLAAYHRYDVSLFGAALLAQGERL